MALNTNKREGDKLHAEEWNELVQEVQGKQSRLNIVDALDSGSAVDVLSAKQGKMLKGMIDNATTNVNNVADVVKTLPVGYFYGTFSTEESLPTEITEKGYAYVGTENPYIIYTFDADLGWAATENKYSTPALETDLSTGSEVKAPTTKAVKEGIESVDVTTQQSFTSSQKETARTNIGAQENITSMQNVQPVVAALNDRAADVVPVTNKVKALGYKVLNPNQPFTSQVVDANTIYEIRDFFDLSGTEQEPATVIIPANCKLRFEGGMLGGEFCTLQGNNTLIESDSVCIQKGITIAGTWGNDTIYTKWFDFISAKDQYLPAEYGTVGVMAPIFEDGVFYKSGRNYVLLSSMPANWPTNWADYYEIIDNEYTSVPSVAPAYVKNTYYMLNEDGTYTKLTSDDAPADWETNYFNYYADNSGTPISGVASDFEEDKYFEDVGEGYEKLLSTPSDWYSAWNTYYVKDGNNYVTPMGIIDNPDATNNYDCFKQLQGIVKGTKGCKIEFEKGYYQCGFPNPNTSPYGTYTIGGVKYPLFKPFIEYTRENQAYFYVDSIPYLDINLNGSKLKSLRHIYPRWAFLFLGNIESCSIHDGEIEGFAQQFDYPYYANRTDSTTYEKSADYEVGELINAYTNCVVRNLILKNTTGDGLCIGSYKILSYNNGTSHVINSYCNKYVVDSCEVLYCGRNGISLTSSNYGNVTNCHIHHIGSTSGSGVIGTDNIKGQNPRSGIDVEFEDDLGLVPIMNWNNLYIHDCSRYCFGFASIVRSTTKTFNITNSVFDGVCKTMKYPKVSPVFDNCKFIVSKQWSGFKGNSTFNNCDFDIRASIFIAYNKYRNCRFVDNITKEPWKDSDYLFLHDKLADESYEGCYFLIKHRSILNNIKFTDCEFVFDKYSNTVSKTFVILAGDSIFTRCKFDAIHSTNGTLDTYNVEFSNNDNKKNTQFFDCEFINLKGTSTSEPAFINPYGYVFDNCKGALRIRTGKINTSIVGNVSINNCDGSYCSINGYYAQSTTEFLIKNSSFNRFITDINMANYPDKHIVDNCVIGTATNYLKRFTINNSRITFAQTDNSEVSFLDGLTINDSEVIFEKSLFNTVTGKITLNRCLVKGAVSQALYQGAAVDCTFENNADSGTSAKRPLYNLVVGQKYYDTTLGKPIFWNGTAWVDGNGEAVGLQVSDTSVLIGAAADSTKTVSVYYGGSTAPTITVLNSDDTANTWLTATLTNNTLTLTAAVNSTSAPRGAKVLITLGDDDLVIINVVQSY